MWHEIIKYTSGVNRNPALFTDPLPGVLPASELDAGQGVSNSLGFTKRGGITMLKILETEVIEWKTMQPGTPDEFPCMFCGTRMATLWLKCQIDSMKPEFVCCNVCSNMTAAELESKFKRGAK